MAILSCAEREIALCVPCKCRHVKQEAGPIPAPAKECRIPPYA